MLSSNIIFVVVIVIVSLIIERYIRQLDSIKKLIEEIKESVAENGCN